MTLAVDIAVGRGGADGAPLLIEYARSYAEKLGIPVIAGMGSRSTLCVKQRRFMGHPTKRCRLTHKVLRTTLGLYRSPAFHDAIKATD